MRQVVDGSKLPIGGVNATVQSKGEGKTEEGGSRGCKYRYEGVKVWGPRRGFVLGMYLAGVKSVRSWMPAVYAF